MCIRDSTRSLAIRQTFLDRPHQEHAELHIERIGDDGSPPEPLTPEELYLSLLHAGFYVKGVAEIGARWAVRQAQWPNPVSYTHLCVGWLRTEENQFLATPLEVIRTLPRRAQELLGYGAHDAIMSGGGYLCLLYTSRCV